MNQTRKIKVLQQVLEPSGSGGVSAEYRALQQSSLCEQIEFEPMILMQCHNGVNLHDIRFYYRRIRESKPDIVHIRGAAPDGLNAVIAAKLARRGKILVTVHGMYSDLVFINPLKRWISRNIIEKLIFGLADGISCVCRAANDRSIFDKYRRKMLPFVYNRMPDYSIHDREDFHTQVREELKLPADALVGIYVGRVTKEKGLTYLAEALHKLDEVWPDNFYLLVVGDGNYLAAFQSNCARLTNRDRMVFLGNRSDVYRYLFAGDFFIQPSLHENHSISLLEAAAAGLPMIATDVGGNGEIVSDGENGVLIEPRSAEALESAIQRMLTDTAFRENLSQNSRSLSYPQYTNEAVDRQLEVVYQKILKGTKMQRHNN